MNASALPSRSRFALRGRSYAREALPGAQPVPARRRRRWTAAILVAALALAAWHLAGAAWIHAKAAVAQRLIAVAWERQGPQGAAAPWPWADTRPIARLTLPERGRSLFVLSGTSGRTLAFGPGHVDGTALPGSAGNSVVVAHRDTHFAFLQDLHEDEEMVVEDAAGRVSRYRVREVAVVDKRNTRPLDAADSPQLTLITCWPFDAVRPGGPQRYVVIADRVPS